MPARYCADTDLLVGDLTLPTGMADTFVNQAADEMDAEIGESYVLPINLGSILPHIALRLKQINVLIATGRLIMAQSVGGEDTSTHAYGTSVLKEGQALLKAICNGQIDLVGVPRLNPPTTGNAPSMIQGDAASAVDAFYGYTGMKGQRRSAPLGADIWSPG